MRAFEHVLVLLSFVYALALTHLLSRIANLYMIRERVKFSALLGIAILNAIQLVFLDWLALWPFRDVTSWDLASIVVEFLLAISLFFMCAVVAPEATEETVDFDAHYTRVRRPFYWLLAIGNFFAMLGNFDFLKSSAPSQFVIWTIAASAGFLPPALALATPARWAQWTAAILLLAMELVGAPLLEGVLR